MPRETLQTVVNVVVRRGRRQGSIRVKEIREELARAKLPADLWKDAIELAGDALVYRRGRYHFVPTGPSRMRVRLHRDQLQQQAIHKVVRGLLARQRRSAVARDERRAHPRVDYVQPALVETEDGRTAKLLTRNISLSGLRVIGASGLQGKKVRVRIGEPGHTGFVVHMLWSCPVGDGLIESGGLFVEMVESGESRVESRTGK